MLVGGSWAEQSSFGLIDVGRVQPSAWIFQALTEKKVLQEELLAKHHQASQLIHPPIHPRPTICSQPPTTHPPAHQPTRFPTHPTNHPPTHSPAHPPTHCPPSYPLSPSLSHLQMRLAARREEERERSSRHIPKNVPAMRAFITGRDKASFAAPRFEVRI